MNTFFAFILTFIVHQKIVSLYFGILPLYEEYKGKIPYNWSKRADHFFSENDRVRKGVKAWQDGDIRTFGKLVFDSGYSSIYQYETGSDELKYMYELMLDAPGIYGGRFSGAGFNGSSIDLLEPVAREDFIKYMDERYKSHFPQLAEQFEIRICKTADGVNEIG